MKYWEISTVGLRFQNKSGTTVREVIKAAKRYGPEDGAVTWKKIQGKGPETGTSTKKAWQRWCHREWLEDRPERLPVPSVHKVDMVFSTGRHTPPWRWVPDLFKNSRTPWHDLVDETFAGMKSFDDWRGIPKEGVNAEQAFLTVRSSLSNWGQSHHEKMITCAWMFSEWFEDFWFVGDRVTSVCGDPIPEENT